MNIRVMLKHLASFLVLIALIVLAVGSDESGSNGGSSTSGASSLLIGSERRISGDHWFGCTDREYFDKLNDYVAQKDAQAFRKALAAGVLTGICTLFKKGEVVYVTDATIFSGLVKVRRKGQLQEFWTYIEAVK